MSSNARLSRRCFDSFRVVAKKRCPLHCPAVILSVLAICLTQGAIAVRDPDGLGSGRPLPAVRVNATNFSLDDTPQGDLQSKRHKHKQHIAISSEGGSSLLSVASDSAAEIEITTNATAQVASVATSRMIPGVPLKSLAKFAALCFICIVAYKFLQQCDCNSRKLDCRRCTPIKRLLLEQGYDEFPDFGVRVSIHSVGDIQAKGMFGGSKEFQIELRFRWSVFTTSPTKDMRWEQTKGMEVPQGASECCIRLQSLGMIKNTTLAEYTLETKRELLDKKDIWDTKQKLKLTAKGKHVGILLVTFRKKGENEEDEMPISGIDEDSSLAMEVLKEFDEMCETPGFVRPQGKLQGDQKLGLLARVLQGDLREIDLEGKEKGKCYVKVINCNFAELQGRDMKEEMEKQIIKARKKGLSEVEKKWYWVWYEDQKKAEDEKKWHYPDGFFPLVTITSVHRSPERDDQFIIKYSGGKTDVLIYRREKGKGLETWVDGVDMIFNSCRDILKSKQKMDKLIDTALPKMRQMHKMFVDQNGFPNSEAHWTAWYKYFTDNNYSDDLVKLLYQEVTAGQPPPSRPPAAPAPAAAAPKHAPAPAPAAAAAPKAAPKQHAAAPAPKPVPKQGGKGKGGKK